MFFWVITQQVVVIPCRNFGDNLSWILKIRPIVCPQTSVWYYHYSLRNNPHERSSNSPIWKMLRTRPRRQDMLHRHIEVFLCWEERTGTTGCHGTFFFCCGVQENRNFPSASKEHIQETRQAYPDSLEVGLWSTLRASIIFFTEQTRRDRQSSWITESPSLCSSAESIWPGSAIGKETRCKRKAKSE
jgi:hypothetical protein